MAIRRKAIGNVSVLGVIGDFYGGDETDELQQAIADEMAGGSTRLVLDLSHCGMMNSSALSVLINAHKESVGRHVEIRLCGLQNRMTNLLVTTRLINVFGHHGTIDEAVASLTGTATEA